MGKPDLILGNRQANFHTYIYEGQLTTSDHIPIICKIATKAILIPIKERRNLNKTDWIKFKENTDVIMSAELENAQNQIDISKNYIENSYAKWMKIITDKLDEVTPKTKYKRIQSYNESELLRETEAKYREIRNRQFWTRDCIREMHILQEIIAEESSRLATENWNTLMNKLGGNYKNPQLFWKDVKKLKGGGQQGSTYLIDERNNNKKVHETAEQLELFRNYWRNVFRISEADNAQFDTENENRILQEIYTERDKYEPYEKADLTRLNNQNPILIKVTKQMVKSIIKNFKNKAPGRSGINKEILSNLPDSAYELYAFITNCTLSMGYFPLIFKEGIIILILKPGKNPRLVSSYRPITLLEVPGKILERIINDRFMYHQETENKFHNQQYGFRKNRGTDIAIAKTYELIALNQREKSQCNIVARDIEKAFDKVWLPGLRYKVMQQGLPDIIEKIIISFTADRIAFIKHKDQISRHITLESGVPQGGILSPSLFIMYTSDMPPPGGGTTDVLFADDVTQVIEYHHASKQMLAAKTQREINRINNYEKLWKIKTSTNKFKILSISAIKPAKVTINGNDLQFANAISMLGIKLTRTGVNAHVRDKINKAKIELSKLKRFKNLTPKIKTHLYKAFIQPIMEYPILPLCGISKSNIMKIQRIQNRAIKFITSNDNEHLTIQQAHEKYNVTAINVRFHNRGKKTWQKLARTEPDLVQRSTNENENNEFKDHYWWRRIASSIQDEEPDPIYT